MNLTKEELDLVELAAADKSVPVSKICVVCLSTIQMMAFQGTHVCGELCRKQRDNEYTPMEQVVKSD